mmetsp:Transcript_31174/g.90969  ORF Transcript_31174/g.90969 Transcript_31174/m.90969 type:complete len:246 (-) Transcript_31174:21-758(-)
MLRQQLRSQQIANSQASQHCQQHAAHETHAERLLPSSAGLLAEAEGEVGVQAHTWHDRQGHPAEQADRYATERRGQCRRRENRRLLEHISRRGRLREDRGVHHHNVAHGHEGDATGPHLSGETRATLGHLEEVVNAPERCVGQRRAVSRLVRGGALRKLRLDEAQAPPRFAHGHTPGARPRLKAPHALEREGPAPAERREGVAPVRAPFHLDLVEPRGADLRHGAEAVDHGGRVPWGGAQILALK